VRRLTFVGGTLLAMLAAAGIGAFIAAHSQARDAPSIGAPRTTAASPNPSGSPAERPQRWTGTMKSVTTRAFRSGGTCSTDWNTSLRVAVGRSGSLSGTGTAVLTSGPNCPFVTGQPQIRRFDVNVAGRRSGDRLQLRLTARPAGNGIDYGGFATAFGSGRTLLARVSGRVASVHRVLRIVPADPTDVSIARNALRLRESG
jgi:hypothetical protein